MCVSNRWLGVLAVLLGLFGLLFSGGCANTQEEMDIRVQQANMLVESAREAGLDGTLYFMFEEQPFLAGLFEGVMVQSPVKMRAFLIANLEQDQRPAE